MREITLDTETTGLSASGGDRMVEIGCVELIDGRRTGNNFHVYLNPERDSNPKALAVHGLTTEFPLDKPRFRDIAEQFIQYISGAVIVIHNSKFDMSFLNYELKIWDNHFKGIESIVPRVQCTLDLARSMYEGSHKLDALCDRFQISRAGRVHHGALLDAELLADVYVCMKRDMDTKNAATIASAGHVRTVQPTFPTIKFGKHIGRTIDKVPADYLQWMVDTPTRQAEEAEAELYRRESRGAAPAAGCEPSPPLPAPEPGSIAASNEPSVSFVAIDSASLLLQSLWNSESPGLATWLHTLWMQALALGEVRKYQSLDVIHYQNIIFFYSPDFILKDVKPTEAYYQ